MNTEEMPDVQDKYVRVMADYSSDGFWSRDGVMLYREDVPISQLLLERHQRWCQWYEQYSRGPIDIDRFTAEGLEIARAIKHELTDWTVIYFDEKACGENRGREQYEYEIVI